MVVGTGFSVAIIGSGPAGFYAAEALVTKAPGISVDILERLPTPYGLVRAGVAPDHQGDKRVVRVFERTAGRGGVRFLGNVTLGRDLSLTELRGLYDAVVLAFGAPMDRRLGIPGENKTGVIGSARFVGWYNGHPDHIDLDPPLDTHSVAIIGNGNVAIDVARILGKSPAELATSDIWRPAAERIAAAPIRDIHVIGRRGAADARFSHRELAELGDLERAVPLVDPADLPAALDIADDKARRVAEANLATLRAFAANTPESQPVRIRFHFNAAPVEVLGNDRVTAVRLERTAVREGRAIGTGETVDMECGLVIACIGYRSVPMDGVTLDESRGCIRNESGRVMPGVYAVGWARRGPSGTIGTNRSDADAVAELILSDLSANHRSGNEAGGPAGLDRLLAARDIRPVTFADWQRIDAAEIAAALPGAPRSKFTTIAEMLAVLGTR